MGKAKIAIAMLAAAVGAAQTRNQYLAKHEIRNAAQRQAVCNDGTPAIYYFRPGAGDGRTKWLVFLQGGGSCGFEADCADRYQNQRGLMSSASNGDKLSPEGIFDIRNQANPFSSFNHVFVEYCSSDTFIGNSERTVSGARIQFRGRKIIEALFADLQDIAAIPRPNLRDATELLFAGSSAGAFGVQNNLDFVASRLPGVRVRGVLDSSWRPFAEPYGENVFDIPRPVGAMTSWDYWQAQGDDGCIAANPNQPNACTVTQIVYPHITTPVFLYADQRDENHVRKQGVADPLDEGEVDYLLAYMAAARQSLEGIKNYFAPAVGEHTALTTRKFYSIRIQKKSFAETLGAWYAETPGTVTSLMTPEAVANETLLNEAGR